MRERENVQYNMCTALFTFLQYKYQKKLSHIAFFWMTVSVHHHYCKGYHN